MLIFKILKSYYSHNCGIHACNLAQYIVNSTWWRPFPFPNPGRCWWQSLTAHRQPHRERKYPFATPRAVHW